MSPVGFAPYPGVWYEGKCVPLPNVPLVLSDDVDGRNPFIGTYLGNGAWEGRYPEDSPDVSYCSPLWRMVIPGVR